jgi:hypothetical protein
LSPAWLWEVRQIETALAKRNNRQGDDLAKVPITERTVRLRLRTALQAQGKHLRGASRQKQSRLGLGRYYVTDANGLVEPDVDLEELARSLGVMQSWETLKPKR